MKRLRIATALASMLGAGLGGCSAEGATAVCPDLPAYNPRDRDAANDPETVRQEAIAADAGCITTRGDAQSVVTGVDGGGGGD